MKQQVSLSEANQHLSRYIEAVERAEEVVIMRHGKPVAKIVRMSGGLRLTGAQELARERMLARMKKGYRLGGCGLSANACMSAEPIRFDTNIL